MLLLKIVLLFCWIAKKECCRIKQFSTPITGKILIDHVLKTFNVPDKEICKIHCYQNEICQSINIIPPLDNGMWRCELSDTDDKQNPDSLKEADGYIYYATKNPCSSSPCVNTATCRPNFLDDNSFKCVCPLGFIGDECDTDVDECVAGTHNCSPDATCVNTLASFTCCSKTTGDSTSPLKRYKGYNTQHPACSCSDVLLNTPESTSGPYYLKTEEGGVAHTYCHMEDIPECGGGGWTLVMKIDGRKTTFTYDANLWSDKKTYSQTSGKTGLDLEETKMPSYWSNPFTKLCLGMRAGGETNWVTVNHKAASLHSLLASNQYQETNIGRMKWKSLLSGSSLQLNCNMEGFNVVSPTGIDESAIARIGIISNNENECVSCNSRLGFGSAGSRGNQNGINSCGNEASVFPDNGLQHIEANCYILVQ